MKHNKISNMRNTLIISNRAFSSYKSNDHVKLTQMAQSAELLYEDIKNDAGYYDAHRNSLNNYMKNVYSHDFCLVLKTRGKIFAYTRHDVASKFKDDKMSAGKASKRFASLRQFLYEIKDASVLFYIGDGFVGTPLSDSSEPLLASSHFNMDVYINENRQKVKLDIIESVILNIYSEIASVTKFGVECWQQDKPIDLSCVINNQEIRQDIRNNILKQDVRFDNYNEHFIRASMAVNAVGMQPADVKKYLSSEYPGEYDFT